ncbi:MAG: efflux RND transporter periplasmic adaptor subunit, partial [Candidatus Binatia bacterium]
MRSRLGYPAASLLLLAVGCAQSGEGKGNGGTPPVFVEVTRAEPETIRDVVRLVGQLDADESVTLRPEIDGRVAEIGFEEGQRVQKGQLVIRLDDSEQKAGLREAEARERLAADTHRRMRELAEQKIVSEAEIVRAARDHDVAAAVVERAEVELEKTRIRAPFDGYAGARLISPGAQVRNETDLVTVHATDRLKLVFTVPEIAVPLVQQGMKLDISVAENPGESFPGEVYFVAPAVNPENRRLLLKAWVSNPGRRLRPGLFATIRVEAERHDRAIVLPDSAVVYDGQGTFVWRVGSEDRAERVGVETGIRQEGRVEIRSGVRPGDVVVAAGTN